MTVLAILLPAFVLSLLLVLTHSYLGLHVLARGIIFVDLALAQVAALGASVAFLMGQDVHGSGAQVYAFAATLIAALGFAQLRRIPGKVEREVIIGCVYVVTTAMSIVVLSRSATGMEELKSLLNGSILWVRWEEIIFVAAVYAAVGIIHAIWRRRFLALSQSEGTAERRSLLWDFLFFATFAVVITVAVNLAGVLVVFAFLIIPAFSASLLAAGFGTRLVIAWGLGMTGTVAGLAVAYGADLPVGATVVSVMGAVPVIVALLRQLTGRTQPLTADTRPRG